MKKYALANQEDMLLCGAGLRLTSSMMAGPMSGTARPVVPGLSVADVQAATAGSVAHFPILVDVGAPAEWEVLPVSVPLPAVRELVFRTNVERDRVAFVRTGDVQMDGVPAAVRPELFDLPANVLEPVAGGSSNAADGQMFVSNRLAGMLCALMHVAASGPGAVEVVAGLLGLHHKGGAGALEQLPALFSDAEPVADGEVALFVACGKAVLRSASERQEDPAALADWVVQALVAAAPADRKRAEDWRTWLEPRLAYQIPLTTADFADPSTKGSAVLRAMTVVLFTGALPDVIDLATAADGQMGTTVAALAGALAGLRAGLASMDWSVKATQLPWISEIACAIDKEGFTGSAITYESVHERGQRIRRLVYAPTKVVISETRSEEEPLLQRISEILRGNGFKVELTADGVRVEREGERLLLRAAEQRGGDGEPSKSAQLAAEGEGPGKREVSAPPEKAKAPRSKARPRSARAVPKTPVAEPGAPSGAAMPPAANASAVAGANPHASSLPPDFGKPADGALPEPDSSSISDASVEAPPAQGSLLPPDSASAGDSEGAATGTPPGKKASGKRKRKARPAD